MVKTNPILAVYATDSITHYAKSTALQ